MTISNINGKVSVLVSGLLVVVLLVSQFQLTEKPATAKPLKQSQSTPLQALGRPVAVAMASVALPPPPLASPEKQSATVVKATLVEKKNATPQTIKKPVLKKAISKKKRKSITNKSASKNVVPKKVTSPTVRMLLANTSPEAKKGRMLLRLLEHGLGPSIGLAWPEGAAARSSLYKLLRRCYGMFTALMAADGTLYSVAESGKWIPDMDRYSGFVRQPVGILPPVENKEAQRARHLLRLGPKTTLVRLFPRHVDAVLLGGLQNLLGGRYKKTETIHARYIQKGHKISIDFITADGRSVPGRIIFSAAQAKCR